MKKKKIFIVSDPENLHYWNALTKEIKLKMGQICILINKEISQQKIDYSHNVIIMDISNIEDLHMLIPKIHLEHPKSRIIIVSSTPTWKQTREVIRLGASNLIRKSSDLDEVITELRNISI